MGKRRIDKYIFLFPNSAKNVKVKVLATYTTKSSAVRAFRRFNVALNDSRNFIITKKRKPIIHFNSGNFHIAKIEGFENEKAALTFINSFYKKDFFLKHNNKYYYFIEDIFEKNLSVPIKVDIEYYQKEYISKINELDIFAYGENLNEVIDEIKENLQILYEDVFNNNYLLADNAKEYKDFLSKHL